MQTSFMDVLQNYTHYTPKGMTAKNGSTDFCQKLAFLRPCANFVPYFSPQSTMTNGKIVFFTAPSGAGKTTIVKHLLAEYPQLAFSISATTRKQRPGEVHGKDYYFLSREEFEQKLANGEFVEHEEVYDGLYYGTLRSEIERIWADGRQVIIDIDVKGGLSLKKHFPQQSMGIFVRLKSLDVLEERLRKRQTETEESLRKRLDRTAYELTFAERFDAVLVNDQLDQTFAEARALVSKYLGI
jgi:guanylate kinase